VPLNQSQSVEGKDIRWIPSQGRWETFFPGNAGKIVYKKKGMKLIGGGRKELKKGLISFSQG